MFELRACCADRETDPRPPLFRNPSGETPSISTSTRIVSTEAKPRARSEATAFHESGHAIAAIRNGVVVEAVTINGQPHVSHERVTDPQVAILIALAGPAAEAWCHRWTIREHDASILDHLRFVQRMGGGSCDLCSAVRSAVITTGFGDDTEVMTVFRKAEDEAIALVQSPENWRMIRAVADALIAAGTLTGNEITAIIRNTH